MPLFRLLEAKNKPHTQMSTGSLNGAGNGTRTRSPLLGKQMRYHCAIPARRSYFTIPIGVCQAFFLKERATKRAIRPQSATVKIKISLLIERQNSQRFHFKQRIKIDLGGCEG